MHARVVLPIHWGMLRRLLIGFACVTVLGAVAPSVASADTIAPTSLDFGTSQTLMSSQWVTITNTSGQSEFFGVPQMLGGVSSPFSVPSGYCGSVPPNGICQELVTFDPNRLGSGTVWGGSYSDTLRVPYSIGLSIQQNNHDDVPMSGSVGYPTAYSCCTTQKYLSFFPYVKDGYRDTDTFSFHASWLLGVGDPLSLQPIPGAYVAIYNKYGSRVRYWRPFNDATSLTGGTAKVTWNGRNQAGYLVPPGTYRVYCWALGPLNNAQTMPMLVSVYKGA
jgi:hypothetical protein